MDTQQLEPNQWYWIRRDDGSLAPYRFHRLRPAAGGGQAVGEFFVGSFIQSWPLSRVVGEARMPGVTPAAGRGYT